MSAPLSKRISIRSMRRFLTAGITLLLLGSCGGGGGGSSSTPDNSGGSGSSGGTTNTNSQPAFSSSTSFSVVENGTEVGTIEVDDADSNDTLALSIEGGADADLFELGVCNASRCTSNSLSFKTAPNFEAPDDASGNNVYKVTIGAFDGTVTVTQDVSISVTNAVEGRVVDAPLSNATVCLDANEDSECGTGEDKVSSDSQGYYALAETEAQSGFELRVLSIGGTDILTNKELSSLALIAEVPADPSQAVAVTPLSTVVSVATNPASVLVALGFPETVTPEQITSIDPWTLATDSAESSSEFESSAALADSIGITTTELQSVAENVVTTSVQIANLIQTADAVVTDTTTSGLQNTAERAAMITTTVTKELVETIDAAVAAAGGAAEASVDLGDAAVTAEVLKETAEESAVLIVEEIEEKQTDGTLDLSDTNDATVAEILQIKETQEVITQTGLDSDQSENIEAVASTAAETNALIETQVANAGVAVLTTASSAEDIAGIVSNTATLAEQLVAGEITTDTFTTSSDVDTQANASGGLNESVAQIADSDSRDDNLADDGTSSEQIVTSDSVFIDMPTNTGEEFTLSVFYRTNPSSVEVTGLGVKMFFDSDKLTFTSLLLDSDEDLVKATTTSNDIQEDQSDLDLDAFTDKFANVAYVSFTGEFAVPSTPLYRISFRATDTFNSGSTQINFALMTAEGFESKTSSVTLSY